MTLKGVFFLLGQYIYGGNCYFVNGPNLSQTWGAPQSRMTLWGEKEQRSGRISGGNARRSKAEFVTTRGWFDW